MPLTCLILVLGASLVAWFFKRPRRPPQRQTVQPVSMAAPIGGVNMSDPPSSLGPLDAPLAFNLIPTQHGLGGRYGSEVHATGVGAGFGGRTLIPFTGGSTANSKLFAATYEGIYDVTSAGAATSKLTYSSPDLTYSGFGIWHSFTTIAGEFMLFCDEQHGYHTYTQSTDTWAAVAQGTGAAQVSGVDPATFAFVTSWKNRVWFVKKGTAEGYYLPVGQVYGAATKFNFGSRFSKGGELAGLWSWTGDGGRGVDDHLVAISTAGEVQIWAGTDPDAVDAFNLVGLWDIGTVPLGRRFVHSYDGDLLILTQMGVLPISKIRQGMGHDEASVLTRKIQPLLSANFSRTTGISPFLYYFFVEHPQERTLNLMFPTFATFNGLSASSVAMSMDTKTWFLQGRQFVVSGSGRFAISAAVLDNVVYFGTNSGTVFKGNTGNDSKDAGGTGGTAFTWYVLFRPLGYGSPEYKQATQARLRYSGSAPTHGMAAVYEWEQFASFSSIPVSGATGGQWYGINAVGGSPSSGRTVALLVAGSGTVTIAGADLQLIVGGL